MTRKNLSPDMRTRLEEPLPLTSGEVAALCGVDPKTVSRWANENKIPHFRTLGGHLRFHEKDVLEYRDRWSRPNGATR